VTPYHSLLYITMSGSTNNSTISVKRKREPNKQERPPAKSKTRRKSPSADEPNSQADIERLESQILESRRHYNNIAILIQKARQQTPDDDSAIFAAVALCRVFARLLSAGDMVKNKGMVASEVVIVQWLKERYREYQDLLLDQYLRGENAPKQSAGLTLLMRLVKEESKTQQEYNWKHGPFPRLAETILILSENDLVRDEFAEKYFKQFDDIRFHTFKSIA